MVEKVCVLSSVAVIGIAVDTELVIVAFVWLSSAFIGGVPVLVVSFRVGLVLLLSVFV